MEILEPKLLILASAGSGKTYQLSNRIIGLVAKGADPQHIVALTFTRKAAAEFADSVLTKLARAATDNEAAERLREELKLEQVDFTEVLNRVSRSLHRITLGTMDSFFARIVRAFQYELGMTGGRFELIEGPRQEMAADAILQHILGDVFGSTEGSEFGHAFRRASIGREQQGVARNLREFIKRWHLRYRQHPDYEWGPAHLVTRKPDDWEKGKHALAAQLRAGLESVEFTDKRQAKTMEKSIHEILEHSIASGSLGSKASALTQSILEAVATQRGEALTLKSYKEFEVTGPAAIALRKWVTLAAQCELSAAAHRSHAVHEVITAYDRQCERLLRTRGQLGFDDVKLLMGQWAHCEEARLRREAVDFRLDSRIDHWLLDEFQDTSPAEWNGLLPLIDEAASDNQNRSIFIVGDRKQAIYAWRGGDVTLFDEVLERYSPELKVEALDESWRSCPEVLALVNQVCGDRDVATAIFGEAGLRWECPAHESAPPLKQPEKRGHSRVEMLDGWDEKYERMEQLLQQLGVGQKDLTCGILLRGNDTAAEVATELRARGFDVILEGRREPGKDSPVGVAVSQLLIWLAAPANRLARGVVEMSPLYPELCNRWSEQWAAIWNGLSASIATQGYRKGMEDLLETCGVDWCAYSRRRIDDILQALGELDHRGNVTQREAAETIERLSIAQSPGASAIQVMTIHKSKGLGFDVVILPEIPSKAVPESQYFNVMEGEDQQGKGWLSEAPPQWSRQFHPQLQELEQHWGLEQQHEAMCTLYVALTRAKRGLHVLLDTPSKSHDFAKPSLANWLMRATGLDSQEDAEPWEQGSIDWVDGVRVLEAASVEDSIEPLQSPDEAGAVGWLTQLTPSSLGKHGDLQQQDTRASRRGMAFGNEVHALLEKVSWTDEHEHPLPSTAAGEAAKSLLNGASTKGHFMRSGRDVRLLREQAVDAAIEGRWISGMIDRLHLHRGSKGEVEKVEIIDFKTDAIEEADELAQAYRSQLHAYRECLLQLYPEAEISCILLSTHLAKAIEV